MATGINFPLGPMRLDWTAAEPWLEQFAFFVDCNRIEAEDSKAFFLANCGTDAYSFVKAAISPTALTDATVVFGTPDPGQTSLLEVIKNSMKSKILLHYERYKLASRGHQELDAIQDSSALRALQTGIKNSMQSKILLHYER